VVAANFQEQCAQPVVALMNKMLSGQGLSQADLDWLKSPMEPLVPFGPGHGGEESKDTDDLSKNQSPQP
jgi:hypothetical protein